MRFKITIGKGGTFILIASMISMGAAPSLPAAYAANEANLVTAEVENGQYFLDINLPSDQKELSAAVENSAASIALHFENNNDSTITVNGQPVIEGTSSPVSLNTGENTINISVNDGINTTIYTLTVTRAKSSNNSLQDIKLSNGELSPKFEAATLSYNIALANDVDSLTVTPVTADNAAHITVNNTAVTEQGVSVQTPAGNTEIKIDVTAENGDAKTYTLNVTRAENPAGTADQTGSGTDLSGASRPVSNAQTGAAFMNRNNISPAGMNGRSGSLAQGSQQGAAAVQKPSTATLSALSVSIGTWNKTFSKDTYTYHIAVTSDVNEVTINETTAYSGASVTINGGTSNAIQLGSQKKTIVPIVVTNGTDQKTYVLVFDKDVQPTTETAAVAVANTADNQAAVIKNSQTKAQSNSNEDQQAVLNNKNNTSSASWWSRLLDSIRSFFSRL